MGGFHHIPASGSVYNVQENRESLTTIFFAFRVLSARLVVAFRRFLFVISQQDKIQVNFVYLRYNRYDVHIFAVSNFFQKRKTELPVPGVILGNPQHVCFWTNRG